LKSFSPSALLHSRFPLAVLAGLTLAAAFPKIGIAGFAWIAPGLMLAVALGKRGGEAFRVGYLAGLAHYLASLSWLLNIPVAWFPILGWLALAAFLALFPAIWVWLTLRLAPGTEGRESRVEEHWLGVMRSIYGRSWSRRMSWALLSAAIWVGLEMVLTYIFGGFPWNLLADSQYRVVPLIQFASFTGVYGVSFLIAWTSVSLLCGAASILSNPAQRSPWMAEIILPFTAVVLAFGYGFHELKQVPAAGREIKLALVQPGIPQQMIWDETKGRERFLDLLRLSEKALAKPADVLVWPEASLPGNPINERGQIVDPIAELARQHKAWLVIGGDDVQATQTETNYYNAAFLIDLEGKLAKTYRKRGLVIFGEYIPLERWLPFIKWFTPITGSYTAGERAVQFVFTGVARPLFTRDVDETKGTNTPSVPISLGTLRSVQTSVLICFEDTFPHLARKSVEPDTDFLVNITNDGWFGEGAAQWQQAAAATFRTVENGVPLVRTANTGLTCWMDANGRWRQLFADENGNVYREGFMTVTIPLPAGRHAQTFYNRHGDWFGWGCTIVAVAGVALRWRRRQNPNDK
jgi:apolipoprotein N-acyltransferase